MSEARTDAAAAFQPAAEVVAQLQASSLPREAKAAMAAFSAELGSSWNYAWSPFRCLFGFTEWTGSLASFPSWPGVVVNGKPTHAFGPWQDEPETYAEIAALTGNSGCEPQDQIANNWVLAVRDFGTRSGGQDLLAALKAGELDAIPTALAATWPAGADQGFGARYTAALALFPAAVPPPPPPPASTTTITLRPGMEASFPIAGTDQDGQPFMPPDALVSDDPKICTVAVGPAASTAAGYTATIAAIAAGNTRVHGADLALAITVEQPQLVHLTADLTKLVISRIPMVAAALAAMMLFTSPAGVPSTSSFAPSNESAKSYMVAAASAGPIEPTVEPTGQIDREPSKIGDPDFCLRSGSLVALERCVRWTAALSRH